MKNGPGENIPGKADGVCKGPKARGSQTRFKTERKPMWLSSVMEGKGRWMPGHTGQ